MPPRRHMSLATFQRVLEAAPKHLWGFEFSEIGQQVSPHDQEFVAKIVLPLAGMCRTHGGKKILFRNKGIFWNGNCYVPYWQRCTARRGLPRRLCLRWKKRIAAPRN